MNDPRREILSQVASGAITAEEGAARLQSLESEPGPAAAAAPVPTPAGPAVKQVRIRARFGNAEVIGDPSVAYAVAQGPHRARQEGDTMVIEQSPLGDDAGFEFSAPQGRFSVRGINIGRELTVRVNPSLALSATVQAGNLSIRGMHGSVTSDVQAGNCSITEFRGPIQVNVAAGEVTASGRLDSGASAIHCKMGDVQVRLDKSSSVRIRAHTTMGEVLIDAPRGPSSNEVVLGSGNGTLDCDCMMGTVHIAVQ